MKVKVISIYTFQKYTNINQLTLNEPKSLVVCNLSKHKLFYYSSCSFLENLLEL
jgi:hypothetical protein